MTIPATESIIEYDGDDLTVDFDIPFVFDTSADLKVIETDEDGNAVVLTTGFSISGGAGSTGTLTRTSALPSGTTLTILDDPDLTQPTDYTANDAFPAPTHEAALDRIVREVKRLHTLFLTCLRVADGDPTAGDGAVIGSVDNRKGKYQFYNASTGAPEFAELTSSGDLSQSIIGGLLYPQTQDEIDASVTPSDTVYQFGVPERWGSGAAIFTAITAVAAVMDQLDLFIRAEIAVPSNVTIPANVTLHFEGEGRLTPANGVTVTCDAFVDAGLHQIFDESAGGSVDFSTTGRTRDFRLEWWGAFGDGVTDYYTEIDRVNVVASAAQGRVLLGRGTYVWEDQDLDIQPNVVWQGAGRDFGTQLKPKGTASLRVVGASVVGGYGFRNEFRDLVIDATASDNAKAVELDTAYNITFSNVFIYNFATTAANSQGLYATEVNVLILDRVVVYGASTSSPHYGIVLDDGVKATIIGIDAELCNRGVYVTGTAHVEVVGYYLERNVTGLEYDGSGSLTMLGGHVAVPNGSSIGVFVAAAAAAHFTIINPSFELNGGYGVRCTSTARLVNSRVIGVNPGDISDPHNSLQKFGGTNVSGYWDDVLYNSKSQTDAASTDHYTITLAANSHMVCELSVWSETGNGVSQNLQTKRFVLSCPSGSAAISTVQDLHTAIAESTGNYAVSLTVTLTPAGATLPVAVTADATGALDDGNNVTVRSMLRVLMSSSYSSYIDTE